jgi:hypothetical protein
VSVGAIVPQVPFCFPPAQAGPVRRPVFFSRITTPPAQPCCSLTLPSMLPSLLPRPPARRNVALAKQVVIGCERAGTLPALRDLLVEESWRDLLADEFGKPYFRDLERFVQAEWGGKAMVFPPKDAIFRLVRGSQIGGSSLLG